MRKFTLLLAMFAFVAVGITQAQTKSATALKGSGEVFYETTFDWADATDERGWSAPEGFKMIDPDDNGMNWHWYPNDSLVSTWTKEPPWTSTSRDDGHLCLFLNRFNEDRNDARVDVNNSIEFPAFDCSTRSSVILEYETSFMCYSVVDLVVQVSNDAGVHWAEFDAGFGQGHKGRPDDIAPGGVALFQANISEVAAGMSEVIVRLTWRSTSLYFVLIDDFKLKEAWDNDLQMKYYTIGWDDGDENTMESVSYMMPKSQLGGSFTGFEGGVLNFGEMDQNDSYLEVDIMKNSQSVFNATATTTDPWISPLVLDTVRVDGAYTPEDYGHFKISYAFKANEEEQTPADNAAEFFFNVTDSVYSRADETMDMSWAYGFEAYQDGDGEEFWNLDHFCGSIFPIYGDCEVDGVSIYITGGKANDSIDFRYSLFWLPPAEEDPDGAGAIEWLTTETMILDSSMFGTWLYLPFDKDGESEFLFEGDIVYAGLSYNNYSWSRFDRRNNNISIGTDATSPMQDDRSIGRRGFDAGWDGAAWLTDRNLMVKLIINDHENRIDGVDMNTANSALNQNYPNPFNRSTEISYELGTAQEVTIEVTDMTGRKVMFMEEGNKPAGAHTCTINAQKLEAGIYFYTLKAGQFEETKRMIVSK